MHDRLLWVLGCTEEQKECVKSGEDWKTNAILRKDVKEEGRPRTGERGSDQAVRTLTCCRTWLYTTAGPLYLCLCTMHFRNVSAGIGKGDHPKLLQNDTVRIDCRFPPFYCTGPRYYDSPPAHNCGCK